MRFEKKPNRAYWRFAWLPTKCDFCKDDVWLEHVLSMRSHYFHPTRSFTRSGLEIRPPYLRNGNGTVPRHDQCKVCELREPGSLERACSTTSEPLRGGLGPPTPPPHISPAAEQWLLEGTEAAPAQEKEGKR